MSKTAFLFPGQGSQYVGMGQDLYDQFAEARARFETANAALGFSLTDTMFGTGGDAEAEADALRQTEVTQPALYVHSLAAMAVLEKQGLTPDMTAGHSLGEYSALVAAGAISFEDGLRVVRIRGALMGRAGQQRPGTMAAILNLDDQAVVDLCEEATEADSLVEPANFNAPGQIVVSGDVAAVERAMALAQERGARKVIALPVSGAFHSALMEGAIEGLEDALVDLEIQEPRCPVYMNVMGLPTTDPAVIRGHLLKQLTAPVRWKETLEQMHDDGATRFLEVGAGRVLSGLAKRTLGRTTETRTYDKAADFGG